MIIQTEMYKGTLEAKTFFKVDHVKKYALTFNLGSQEGRITAVWTKSSGRNAIKPTIGENYSFSARQGDLSSDEKNRYPGEEMVTHRIIELKKTPPPKKESTRPKQYSL